MSIKAMKLALNCLEDIFGKEKIDVGAINALRQAIKEAEEQEPLCFMDEYGYVEGEMKRYMEEQGGWFPVYTHPPKREWVGLTDEEYKKIRYGSDEIGELYVSYALYDEGDGYEEIEIHVDDFAKAIEAKLREKNT